MFDSLESFLKVTERTPLMVKYYFVVVLKSLSVFC